MTVRVRTILFLAGAAGMATVLGIALTGLPDFGAFDGAFGTYVSENAVGERVAQNVVSSIVFDYRGFDTLGEEFILFASVVAVALLLRRSREEEVRPAVDQSPERHTPEDSDAVRELTLGLVAPAVLFGLYVVAHGNLTPGGGFQGGVVLATAPLFMYLGGEYAAFRRLSPEALIEVGEGAGAGGFAAIGLAGLLAGGAVLDNFLPLGRPGELLSGGTIPLLNYTVGLAVAAGLVLLLSEFLEQTLSIRMRRPRR